jgi:hypothetical protein
MPLSMYGNTNPKGLEPFQIESVLAPLAVGNNQAEAQMMLENYQQQRQASTNLYGQDLQQQHQAFYDQLANQMQQAQMKEIPNLLKAPGGAALLGPGGLPGMSMGADPSVIQDAINRANAAQAAESLQKSGTGINQLSQAGMPTTPQAASGVTGLPIPQYLGPALVQKAQIDEAARLGAASIGAAGKGQPSASMQVRDPNTGELITLHVPRATPTSVGAAAKSWGVPTVDQPPANAPIPGQALPGVPALPMTQTDTPANAPAPPPQNTAAGTPNAQATVKANLANAPAAVRSDVLAAAAKNGGNPVIGRDAQGPYVLGASGTKHR